MIPGWLDDGPFGVVFDVGGNVGEFAEAALGRWPKASVYSFEPLPPASVRNRERAAGRWSVYEVAIGEAPDRGTLYYCLNQHSASTMQEPGAARLAHFGLADEFRPLEVEVLPLDSFLPLVRGRLLVKVDVEGSELQVLRGARETLLRAEMVVCEVQNDPEIFIGSASAWEVDLLLREAGLHFAGLAGALLSPASGGVLQFDGVWVRERRAWDDQAF